MFTRSSQQLNAVPHQTIISTKNMNIQLKKIYKVNSENYNDGCFIILLIFRKLYQQTEKRVQTYV